MARSTRTLWKAGLGLGTALTFGAAAVLWASDLWVRHASTGRYYSDLTNLPPAPVAMVLGCSPKLVGGAANPFFTARIRAAVRIYTSGKIGAIIVSGDNGTSDYDEPTAMKQALVAAGVPEDRIYCDFAGFRTLDSVVRTRTIFGQKRFIVVSQRFHNERAVFLAQRHGLDAIAFDAEDVSRAVAPTTYLREHFARVQAVLDVTLLQRQPKFSGPPVAITW